MVAMAADAEHPVGVPGRDDQADPRAGAEPDEQGLLDAHGVHHRDGVVGEVRQSPYGAGSAVRSERPLPRGSIVTTRA